MARFTLSNIIFIVIFLVSCSQSDMLNSDNNFKFKLDGKNLKLNTSSPFALMFFGEYCVSCSEQIDIINSVLKEQSFDFFAVLVNVDDEKEARKILEKKGINFPTIYKQKQINNIKVSTGDIMGVPMTFFYNSNGEIAAKCIGICDKNLLLKFIDKSRKS